MLRTLLLDLELLLLPWSTRTSTRLILYSISLGDVRCFCCSDHDLKVSDSIHVCWRCVQVESSSRLLSWERNTCIIQSACRYKSSDEGAVIGVGQAVEEIETGVLVWIVGIYTHDGFSSSTRVHPGRDLLIFGS